MVAQGLLLERHNQLLNYDGYMSPSTVNYGFTENDKVLFEAFITVDEKYFVMNDHVIDIQEKKNLGYLWDSLDVFKTIFGNVEIDNPEYKELQEEFESLPLLESERATLYAVRDYLIENWLSNAASWVKDAAVDFYDWGKEKVTSAAKSVKDFAVASWEKAKKFGLAISQGDWSKVLSMIGKGALWVLRKFKAAAYSTIGIIVDAILVATGVGKVPQMVFWGLVTGLDIYQLASGDWKPSDTPQWAKWLDLLCDIVGLTVAGVAAKGARGVVKGITTISKASRALKQNKAIMGVIKKIRGGVSWLMNKIKSVLGGLKGKWKALDRFIDKILGFANKVFNGLKKFANKLFPAPETVTRTQRLKRGATAGATAVGITYGIDSYAKSKGEKEAEKLDQAIDTLDLSTAEFDYDEI